MMPEVSFRKCNLISAILCVGTPNPSLCRSALWWSLLCDTSLLTGLCASCRSIEPQPRVGPLACASHALNVFHLGPPYSMLLSIIAVGFLFPLVFFSFLPMGYFNSLPY